jgi:hypothetical protein
VSLAAAQFSLFVYKQSCAPPGKLSSVVAGEKRRCRLKAQIARHVCSQSGQTASLGKGRLARLYTNGIFAAGLNRDVCDLNVRQGP